MCCGGGGTKHTRWVAPLQLTALLSWLITEMTEGGKDPATCRGVNSSHKKNPFVSPGVSPTTILTGTVKKINKKKHLKQKLRL